MKFFVTGAAGFIGSTLVDRLLSLGHTVTGYDNFSSGQEFFIENAVKSPNFELIRADLLDLPKLMESVRVLMLLSTWQPTPTFDSVRTIHGATWSRIRLLPGMYWKLLGRMA